MSTTLAPIPEPLFVPLHHRVKGQIRQRIGNQWRAGERLPSIHELAGIMGVSLQTAHRAVRELTDEGVLVSSPRRGTFVSRIIEQQSVQHGVAPSLAGRGIRIIRPIPGDGMHTAIARAFEDKVRDTGGRVGRAITLEPDNRFEASPESDALVIINPNSRPAVSCGPDQVMVVITTSAATPVAMSGRFDVVSVDQVHGAYLAGECLARVAGSSLAYIGSWAQDQIRGQYDRTSSARLEGFVSGACVPVPKKWQLFADSYSVGEGARLASEYLRLKVRPHGIFAASDELAVGFICGLLSHGLIPGRDYAIVGFDGQELGQNMRPGPLSTVSVPTDLLGRSAAELLASRLADPDQPVRRLSLGCSLIQGQTLINKPQNI